MQPDSTPATPNVASPQHLAFGSSAQEEAGAGQQAHVPDDSAQTGSDLEALAGMAGQAPEDLSQAEASSPMPESEGREAPGVLQQGEPASNM